MRFDQHTVVLLSRPENPPQLPRDAADRLQQAHLAHQAGLVAQGAVLAAGPFLGGDDPAVRGFAVLSVDPQLARELYANDPAVSSGQLVARVLSWQVPEGVLRFEEVPVPTAMLELAAGD